MREGRADTAFLRKGEQRVGGREGEREWERERAQPRSKHLVCVEDERIEENSTLNDLSPISIETADKGDDIRYKLLLPPQTINKHE